MTDKLREFVNAVKAALPAGANSEAEKLADHFIADLTSKVRNRSDEIQVSDILADARRKIRELDASSARDAVVAKLMKAIKRIDPERL
jgi:hypothetical protein